MKGISEQFTEEEFDALSTVKGERSWRQAIIEEFGVEEVSADG